MALYYINSDFGAGIREADTIEEARRNFALEVGYRSIRECREATDEDIDWIKGMGGIVPKEGCTDAAT